MLIEQRHRILRKEEMLDQVWPGLVVEENNLATQVSTLRKVLGAQAITTIPGRGYRFTAPVRETSAPDGSLIYEIGGNHESPSQTTPAAPAATFALPKSASAAAVPNAEAAVNPPFGRDELLRDLLAVLRSHQGQRPAHITLLGPGGMGKTRLARALVQAWCQAGDAPPAWLDLSAALTAGDLAQVMAKAWGSPALVYEHHEGVDDTTTPPDTLDWPGWLAPLPAPAWPWLVLDNAEQIASEVAACLDALSARWPGLSVVVTSQVPLRTAHESLWRVGPLALPAPSAAWEEARASAALACFEQAAKEADRHFHLTPENLPLVEDICASLGSVPLALRLAAARLPLLGLAGLKAALEQRMSLLRTASRNGAGDADALLPNSRHHSLTAVLDWSHSLLPAAAQGLWLRLAVVRGNVSLALANALGLPNSPPALEPAAPMDGPTTGDALEPDAMEALSTLVERGFVDLAPGTEESGAGLTPSYRLPETHRVYALERLRAQGLWHDAQRRLAQAVRHRMALAEASYWSEPDTCWLSRFAPDLDALRSALDWAASAEPAWAHGMVADACFLWLQLGLAGEARQRWLALANAPAPDGLTAAEKARFKLAGCRLHWGLQPMRIAQWASEALQAATAAQDQTLQFQAWRCGLGSGQLSAAEASQALAEMTRLVDPRWPPRLRAQQLLALADHLSFHAPGGSAESRPAEATPPQASAWGAGTAPGAGRARRSRGAASGTGPGIGLPAALQPAPSETTLEATLTTLAQTRREMRDLADAADLQSLASLARIGLAECALWSGKWQEASGLCEDLLQHRALPGNQQLQALAVLAAAELAQADQCFAPDAPPQALAAANHALARLARRSAERRWEWFDLHVSLFAWWLALRAAATPPAEAAPTGAAVHDAALEFAPPLGQAAALAAALAAADLARRTQPPSGLWTHWLRPRAERAMLRLPTGHTPDVPWLADATALGRCLGWPWLARG